MPPLPHIGFLLKFFRIAVEMMAEACPGRVAGVLMAEAARQSEEAARQLQKKEGDTTASASRT